MKRTSSDVVRQFGKDWEIKESHINNLRASTIAGIDEEIAAINNFIDNLLGDRFHLESEKIELVRINDELKDEIEVLKNLLKEIKE